MSQKKVNEKEPFVGLKNDSPNAMKAQLYIGDTIIPFYKITLEMAVDEVTRITAEVPAQAIDVVALQKNTTLVIVDETKQEGEVVEDGMGDREQG